MNLSIVGHFQCIGILESSSINNSFMVETVFAELHWDAGILQMIGIFE